MTDDVVRVHLRVHGRVQGVSYRAYAHREAQRLQLQGWVRNERDGTVTAIAQGPREDVHRFVTWCRRGSPAASVDRVDETWLDPEYDLRGFVVRRSDV